MIQYWGVTVENKETKERDYVTVWGSLEWVTARVKRFYPSNKFITSKRLLSGYDRIEAEIADDLWVDVWDFDY